MADPRSAALQAPLAQQTDQDKASVSLLDYARTLWNGKWLLLVAAVLGLAYGYWQAYGVMVPRYRATAQMALVVRTEQVVDLQEAMAGVSRDERSMNTEMALIRSRDLIGQLVDRLELTTDPEFNPYLDDPQAKPSLTQQIRNLRYLFADRPARTQPPAEQARNATIDRAIGAIATSGEPATYIFNISATTRNPAKSTRMANTLAQIYYDDQIAQKVAATENAAEFLSVRVGELRVELSQRQAEIAAMQGGSTLATTDAAAALGTQQIELQTRLSALRREYDQASTQAAALAAATTTDQILAAASDGQLTSLAQAIAADQPGAQLRFDRRVDQIRQQTGVTVDRVAGLIDDVEGQLADLNTQTEAQSAQFLALQQFDRETEATRALYDTFLTRLKEITVQEGVLQADSRILSEATGGFMVTSRASRVLLRYLLIGLLAGSALVLLRERLQNTFRTARDLEAQSGLAVFGQIPIIPAKTRTETIAYLREKPSSAAAEAIRNLRTSLLLSNIDNPPQVIMSTSTVPGEGKTTLAIALAENLAGMGKRVLLIEGDIRRRTFNAYFTQAEGKAGILSVIARQVSLSEAIHTPVAGGMDVLMGEKSNMNAADIFSSESFQEFLAQVRSSYDYVVIDTPPVLVVPDARVIGQYVDAVLYSVRWDKTNRAQVLDGLHQLRSVNVPVAGLALSQVDAKGMRRYGYGYGTYGGRYGSYGGGYYEN